MKRLIKEDFFSVPQIKYNGEFYHNDDLDAIPFLITTNENIIYGKEGSIHDENYRIARLPWNKRMIYGRVFHTEEDDYIIVLSSTSEDDTCLKLKPLSYIRQIVKELNLPSFKVFYYLDYIYDNSELTKLEGKKTTYSHSNKWYNKLAYRDHNGNIRTDKEPMTLAQYHSLIYQEGNEIKNNPQKLISERNLDFIIKDAIQESLFTHYGPWELAEALDKRNIAYSWSDKYNHMKIFYNDTNKETIQRLVNLSGWQIVKSKEDYFEVERKYGDDASSYYSRDCEGCTYPKHTNEFYHITLERNVPRIMKYGLVPKDNKKLDMTRGDRIYLLDAPDEILTNELVKRSNYKNENYVVLSVDLSKMKHKPKLYHDDYSPNGCLYTTENIPPYCITIFNEDEY